MDSWRARGREEEFCLDLRELMKKLPPRGSLRRVPVPASLAIESPFCAQLVTLVSPCARCASDEFRTRRCVERKRAGCSIGWSCHTIESAIEPHER
jgi:hypothetical protein